MATQLRLNTTANARRALARVVREVYVAPDADLPRLKATVHGISALLAYDKHLLDVERIVALEARMADIETRR